MASTSAARGATLLVCLGVEGSHACFRSVAGLPVRVGSELEAKASQAKPPPRVRSRLTVQLPEQRRRQVGAGRSRCPELARVSQTRRWAKVSWKRTPRERVLRKRARRK
jgi:hypothetical protein